MARIIATASVRLTIDRSGLGREIRRAVQEATSGLKERLPLDVDADRIHNQIEQATRDRRVNIKAHLQSRQFTAQLLRLQRTSRGILSAMLSGQLFLTAARAVRDYGAVIAAILPTVASFGAGLIQATQAIAVVPAIGAAAAASIAALVIGFQGFGDALKNMGDLEKFNEALKNLAPNARDAARTIRGLREPFRELRLDVQQQLFKGVGDSIDQLAKANLPTLSAGLSGIARELGRGFNLWADWASQASTVSDLDTILENTRDALRQLAPAGRDFAAALTDIVTVGSDFLPGFASSMGDAAKQFREFIAEARETGQLKEFIQDGITAFGNLFTIIVNLGKIINTVFQGLSNQTGDFLGNIAKATGRFDAFLKSVEGQQALATLRETLNAVSQVFRQVFGEALRQIIPILQEILPFLQDLTAQIGGALVAAMQVVGPLLQNVAGFLSANKDVLAPLAAGFILVTTATKAFRIALLALSTANPFLLIATAVIALVALIVTNWDSIVAFLKKAWEQIKLIAVAVWNGIIDFFRDILAAHVAVFKAVWNGIKNAVMFVWNSIKAGAKTIWNGIKNFFVAVLRAHVAIFNAVWNGIKNFLSGLWRGIANTARSVWNGIKNFFSSLMSSVRSSMSAGWNTIRTIVSRSWSSIKSAVSSGVSAVINFVRRLPGRILSAIGNLGRLLFNAGRDLLRGLINGIGSMVGNVINSVVDIGRNILGSIKGALGIGSPSKEMMLVGQFAGEGLVIGLKRIRPAVEREAAKLGDAVNTGASTRITARQLVTTAPGQPGAAVAPAGGFTQNNIMQPGTDVQQFADTVLRRGMGNLSSGGGVRAVARNGVQRGVNDNLLEGVRL